MNYRVSFTVAIMIIQTKHLALMGGIIAGAFQNSGYFKNAKTFFKKNYQK